MKGEADYLQKCYEQLDRGEENLDNYRIKVHAMKSSSALIGANGLSEMAKTLEFAAKDGDKETIYRLTEEFLETWRSYKEKLSVCIKEEEKTEIQNMSLVTEKLQLLQEAMENMDVDMADDLMKELRQYQYEETLGEKIENLATAVVNLDSDSVAEELYKCLNRSYRVQFCTDTNETMQNMMRIVKPDMVMINAAEQGDIGENVFEFLHNFYLHLPVVVVGKKENCDCYN